MARNGKTQPWVWVAIGCGVAVSIGVLVVAGLGFAGWRWAKSMEEQLEDPAAREAKVLEVLGAERLPEGYYPVMAMEVPFAMKVAMISDRPVDLGENGSEIEAQDLESGMMYFEMTSWGVEAGELEDFIEGRTDDADFLRQSSIDLESGEVIHRGEVILPGIESVRYVVQRSALGGRGGDDGLSSKVLVECAGDSRTRFALWFGPDPAPETPPVELDLTGTVGDPARLTDFLGAFRFCL